jgi:hypothetical protein
VIKGAIEVPKDQLQIGDVVWSVNKDTYHVGRDEAGDKDPELELVKWLVRSCQSRPCALSFYPYDGTMWFEAPSGARFDVIVMRHVEREGSK